MKTFPQLEIFVSVALCSFFCGPNIQNNGDCGNRSRFLFHPFAFLALLPLPTQVPGFDGFADSYTLSGCVDPAQCGVFSLVDAHCGHPGTADDQCCAGNAYARPGSLWPQSLCDGAPVYQREGDADGAVLYRKFYRDGRGAWGVGESGMLGNCGCG
eukprot:COSAG04_NODE_8338_length_988_cov_1.033746_2_plen_155_part_01